MEFTTGKDGIGPFALNITNLALTQYAHLTMAYGEDAIGQGGYDFGNLDEISGQDGLRISDWLSAMVNAHVDVAKDPYIFDLNINKFTYKYTNFMLRAGKGLSTFTLLAQPLIVKYASAMNNAGGIYGGNLDIEESESNAKFSAAKTNIRNKLIKQETRRLRSLLSQNKDNLSERTIVNTKAAIEYFEAMTMREKERKQKYDKNPPTL
jgi:hypothetical protein